MSDLLSIQQAAAYCGVAERTVRRWVVSRRLKSVNARRGLQVALADLEPFKHGEPGMSGQVRTEPGDKSDMSDHQNGHVRTGPTSAPDAPDMLEALRLIERQQQTIMELSGRCGYLQAELATAREKLLALEEPREDPVVLLDRVTAERNEVDAKPRRWWWLWGLLVLGIATVACIVMFPRLPITGS